MRVTKLRRVPRLLPSLKVAALKQGARYLVTVPDNCDEKTCEIIRRQLTEADIRAVVVPESLKFYKLSAK